MDGVGGERAESFGNWDAMLTILRDGQPACANARTKAYVTRGGGRRSFAARHWPHLWLSATTYSFESLNGCAYIGSPCLYVLLHAEPAGSAQEIPMGTRSSRLNGCRSIRPEVVIGAAILGRCRLAHLALGTICQDRPSLLVGVKCPWLAAA